MAINLELKTRVKDYDSIKQMLGKIGANYVGTLNQKDIYYKVSGGLLKMRIENGNISLIRYNREEKETDRWSNYDVVKLEGKETEKLFLSLFQIEVEVVKKRGLYLYKDTRIHLDTVENLGSFIELETVVKKSKEHAKELFDEMVEILKLDLSKQTRLSYRDLSLSI